MAEVNEKEQGIFDFDSGNLDGYKNLQREQEHRLQSVRKKSGLPVGRWVELMLKGHAGCIVGKLELRSYPNADDGRGELELQINKIAIKPADIESCVMLDDQDI